MRTYINTYTLYTDTHLCTRVEADFRPTWQSDKDLQVINKQEQSVFIKQETLASHNITAQLTKHKEHLDQIRSKSTYREDGTL